MDQSSAKNGGLGGLFRKAVANALKPDRQRLEELLQPHVEKHLPALALRRSQLVRRDPYGNSRTEKWDAELTEFIHRNLFTVSSIAKQLGRSNAGYSAIRPYIEERIRQHGVKASRAAVGTLNLDGCSPAEFERLCASALRRMGWTAEQVGAAGDQGADVIATKAGVKLVVQCKLYSKPVGNGAVQEAHSARGFYAADKAAVVSNQPFTTSAQQLASRLGVALVNYSSLASASVVL